MTVLDDAQAAVEAAQKVVSDLNEDTPAAPVASIVSVTVNYSDGTTTELVPPTPEPQGAAPSATDSAAVTEEHVVTGTQPEGA